jgi:hypothetical protein
MLLLLSKLKAVPIFTNSSGHPDSDVALLMVLCAYVHMYFCFIYVVA